MHERFFVRLQLCFVVSFVLRVPGPQEGVISSGKAWGWSTGTLILMPGAPGKCTLAMHEVVHCSATALDGPRWG